MHCAAHSNSSSIAQLLLSKGAAVDATDGEGCALRPHRPAKNGSLWPRGSCRCKKDIERLANHELSGGLVVAGSSMLSMFDPPKP